MAERTTSLSEFTGLGGRATARSMGTPIPGGGQTVALSVTSASSTKLPEGVHVAVYSTVLAFLRMGVLSTDAAVSGVDMPIPANTLVFLHLGRDDSNNPYRYISAVASAGTGSMYIMPMQGNQY